MKISLWIKNILFFLVQNLLAPYWWTNIFHVFLGTTEQASMSSQGPYTLRNLYYKDYKELDSEEECKTTGMTKLKLYLIRLEKCGVLEQNKQIENLRQQSLA